MKKYLYNGKLFTAEQIAQAANKRGMDFGAYVSQFGITEQSDAPTTEPQEVKKKEQPSLALNTGGAAISQSPSNSISAFDLAGNVQTNPNDAILQAKRKGEENLAQQEVERANKISDKINSTEFGKAVNFGSNKTPKVTLNDGTTVSINSLTNVPFITPNVPVEKAAQELQNKIAVGVLSDEEINFLSTQKKESPALIKARLSNIKEDIDVETINDADLKTENNLKSVFELAKNKFGVDYNFDEDLSSELNTKSYLDKLRLRGKELQKAGGEQASTYANVDGSRTYSKSKRQLSEIEDLNSTIASIEKIGQQKELQRIVEKPFTSTGERLRLTTAVMGDVNYQQNAAAQKEREDKEKESGWMGALLTVPSLIKKLGTLVNGDGDVEKSNATLGEARLALAGAMTKKAQKDIALFNQTQKRLKDGVNEGKIVSPELQAEIEKQAKEIDGYLGQIESSDKIYKEHPTLKKAAVTSLMNDVKAMQSGNISDETDDFDNTEYNLATGKITEADRKKYGNTVASLYGDNIDRFADGIRILKYLESKGVDVNDKVVLDAIKEDKTKEYYATEPLATAAIGVFANTLKGIGTLTGFRDDLDRLSEKKVDALNPKKVGQLDKYKLDKTTETLQTISETTGQVLGQGALGFIGGGGLVAAGVSKVAATYAAGASVGFLSSYDNNYKDAYDLPNSTPLKRAAYATLLSAAEAASESIFPESKIFGEIPGVKQIFGEWAQKVGTREFTNEMQQELLGKAKSKVLQFTKGYVTNTGKEVTEEDVVSIFTSITRAVFGDKEMNFDKAYADLKETTYQTAVGMAGIAGVGAYRDMQSERNNSSSAQLFNAATYFDEAGDAITKGFKQGLYDGSEKNRKMLILNTAVSKVEEIKNVENVLNRKLSLGEKESYVANATAQSVLNEQKKTASDDLMPIIDAKLENLKKRQSEILNGEVKFEADGTILSAKAVAPTVNTPVATPLADVKESVTAAIELAKGDLKLVEDLQPNENLGEMELGVLKADPIAAFKMVADQSQGFSTAADGTRTAVTPPDPQEATMRKKYGGAIVDRAMELYPVPVTTEAKPVAEAKQTEFVPTPLKTSLTPAEVKQIVPSLTRKEQIEWVKAGKPQETLLKIANDKITAQNDADKSAFVPQSVPSEKANESQPAATESTPAETDSKITEFIAKESQYEALERLTTGIKDLPADQQRAEIERRAEAHEKSYKEFTKGENKISESNSKAERVEAFGKLTANAMQKFLKQPDDFQADSGDFANGKRIDENGRTISEDDFVTLKEKVKQLRKQKNVAEIDKINAAPRAYLDNSVKTDWNKLSMQEKLALAKENLPEVEKMSDLDAAKVADKNAKQLLQKLRGDSGESGASLVVNDESRQALRDIIQLTDSRDIADYVANGDWNGEGDFGFDSDGNVVLTRFADTTEGLTKSGKVTSPEELQRLMNFFGGEQVPTSGVAGGMVNYKTEDGVVGTFRIPFEEFKNLIKDGYIQFAGFGNKEFVLSPHIASKYLTEINGKKIKNDRAASTTTGTTRATESVVGENEQQQEGQRSKGGVQQGTGGAVSVGAARAIPVLDLPFVEEKNIPKVNKIAKNKEGAVVGKKAVPNPYMVKEQKEIEKKLETLKEFVECLIK